MAVDERPLTDPETMAVKEVQRYASSGNSVRAYNKISNFMEGDLVCVSYKDTDNLEHHVLVLVKNGNAQIYYQWENLLALVPGYKPSVLKSLSDPQVIVAMISVLIFLMAGIMAILHWSEDNAVREPFRSAFAAMIGYWLGQVNKQRG